MKVSGGVGTIVGFAHDWANPENTRRSWDMVARYVIPEIHGLIEPLRKSRKFVIENRDGVRARRPGRDGQDHGEREGGRRARSTPAPAASRFPTINAPDLQKEAAKRKKA